MTQLNQNTTNLQSILDAVNALPEATSVSGTISITENGTHDVARYATANVNVQSAPVLLWTNASPTSNFSAQDITVGQYAGVIVECRGSVSNANTRKVFFANGEEEMSVVIPANNIDSPGRSTARNIQYSGNTVTISEGRYQGTTTISSTVGIAYCIPTRIWGVKFTL